jgi:hypothetical protein
MCVFLANGFSGLGFLSITLHIDYGQLFGTKG